LLCYITANLIICSSALVALGARRFRAGLSRCCVLLASSAICWARCCWLEVTGAGWVTLHRLHAIDNAWSHDHLARESKSLCLLLLKLLVLLLLHLLWG
jgi:hypothetical protein